MPSSKTAKSASNKPAEEQNTRMSMLTSKEASQGTQLHVPPAINAETLGADISQNVVEKISALMDKKFEELSATLNNIAAKVEANIERITEAEHRISAAEDSMSAVTPRLAELEAKVRILTEKCSDMEGRSRRDNILIYNLKEETEGRQPVAFFEHWLPTLLNLETKRGIIKIDRAHRSLGPPRPDRPRAVIIKLHNSGDKSRILTTARKQAPLTYEGLTVFIRQDITAPVKEMRRAFNGVCERLIKRDVRFSMRYPATLTFTHGGKTRSFRSPKDALAFLDELD
uniref:L1 transposable element RRM domain-containing protein n=1 Tax=Amphiprion percula TaxID=161767 RepID=A0A3P8S1H5_AMPPE